MQNFTLDFGNRIENILSKEDLKAVLTELDIFCANYDITKKETTLSTTVAQIPDEFRMFMVAKKVAGRSEGTLKLYAYHIAPFLYAVGKPIAEIKDMDIIVYLYTLQKNRTNLSNHSLENIRLIFSSFFTWCHDNGYISQNPMRVVQPIRYEKKEIPQINDEEFERIRLSFTNVRDKAIFETLYSSGCRVGELLNIKVQDLDLRSREIHLFGKGQKHRTSFLNTRAVIALKDYLDVRPESQYSNLFLKLKKPHKPINQSGVRSMLRKHGDLLQDGHLHPHLLRHQFANTWVDKGLPVEELQQILGHEKLSTTQLYFNASKERAKLNYQKFIA